VDLKLRARAIDDLARDFPHDYSGNVAGHPVAVHMPGKLLILNRFAARGGGPILFRYVPSEPFTDKPATSVTFDEVVLEPVPVTRKGWRWPQYAYALTPEVLADYLKYNCAPDSAR
jgi:hypothetical protein